MNPLLTGRRHADNGPPPSPTLPLLAARTRFKRALSVLSLRLMPLSPLFAATTFSTWIMRTPEARKPVPGFPTKVRPV